MSWEGILNGEVCYTSYRAGYWLAYAATLLDSACGIATASRLAAGETFTTIEIKVAYHRAMTEHSGPVRAEAIVKNMGRRVAYADAKLTDADGRLLASATSTLLVMSA